MRILHTSDWHLGRQFLGVPLEDDHDAILSQVKSAISAHSPDVLIIAGDVFDKLNPPQSAMHRLRDFMRLVTSTSAVSIVVIAGNHDAAAQIGVLGVLAPGDRMLVRGPLDKEDVPLVLQDEHGSVAISALPFSYEYAARACFEDDTIGCPADVIRAQVEAARTKVPQGARWVVVAHTFVDGATTSESERPLSRTAGGIESVPAKTFDGAHYVALGHLHRPQSVGAEHIRYSGSPLIFGFDEEGQQKSMTLVDLGADGRVATTCIPLEPLRKVRTVRGKFHELLAAPDKSLDFIRIVLTDEAPLIDPMKRIRDVYPNAVQLTYERDSKTIEERLLEGTMAIDDPETLVGEFLSFVRDAPPSESESEIIKGLVHEASGEIGG